MTQSPKWGKSNPAPLPNEARRQQPLVYTSTITYDTRSKIKESIHGWYMAFLSATRSRKRIERVVYGDNLEKQVAIILNTNLEEDDLEHLVKIMESIDYFNGVSGMVYLREIIEYQPILSEALLTRLAKDYTSVLILAEVINHPTVPTTLLSKLASESVDPKVLNQLATHPRADEDIKVLAALRLGTLAP